MKVFVTTTLAGWLVISSALATDTTWDGGAAGTDAGGDWSALANWDTDAVPTTADLALLPSVTAGMRIVTQDVATATTCNALRLVQSGTAATNKLSLAGNLLFSKSSREAGTPDSTVSALQVSLSGGAQSHHVAIDLNGYAIIFPNLSPSGSTGGGNVSGTVRYSVDGSSIHTVYPGHTAYNVFGTLVVMADGRLGRDTAGSASTGNGTITLQAGSALLLSGGTFAFELAGRRSQDRSFGVNNSGAIDVGAGTSLEQRWTATSNSGNRGNVVFENRVAGTIRQAGTMAFRIHHNVGATPALLQVRNYGMWRISGVNAVLRRLTTSQDGAYIVVPAFTNFPGASLQGDTVSDTLEFDEEVADGSRRMTIANRGRIAPGAGSQGSTLSSVGALRLSDIDLAVEAAGAVAMDLGGPAAGQHDSLLLQAGATAPAGAGNLALGAGATLELHTVNGFIPGSSFAIDLLTAGSVTGEFTTATLDGDAFTDNELAVAGAGKYVLTYTADTVRLNWMSAQLGGTVLLIQ